MAEQLIDRPQSVIFWMRRDLRAEDNHGFQKALQSGHPVIPVFIFDSHILEELPEYDRRVCLIHDTLTELHKKFAQQGGGLFTYFGTPESFFEKVQVKAVYTNHDHEPYATERDEIVARILAEKNISFYTFKDHLIFEREEVMKADGKPYTVFTPYSRVWKKQFSEQLCTPYPLDLRGLDTFSYPALPSLESMGFKPTPYTLPTLHLDKDTLDHYAERRDLPWGEHTTNLSVHLRFGLISVRKACHIALKMSPKLLDELIWREFYSMILWNFPDVVANNFKREFDEIPWKNDPRQFQAWCEGKTGYPLVDAGMRELNETGVMNNRARMIAAGFLTKHLLTHWSYGESYFARHLMDYELASNNGNWQWAAGTGCDAAPYFRIFNPISQQEKFDPDFKYIKKWIPEFGTNKYPSPIVDHKTAREETLEAFQFRKK